MNWADKIAELIKDITKRNWVWSYFSGVKVMDLRDGSWLRLEEDKIKLCPGASNKTEHYWFSYEDPEVIVKQLTKDLTNA